MISLIEHAGRPPLYRIKITLKGSSPAIWRRIVVRSDMKLNRFHNLLQAVMGWTDSHLHQFVVKNDGEQVFIGVPDPDCAPTFSDTLNEKRFSILDILCKPKQKILYEYDFGDGWEHILLLEKILPADPGFKHPVCLAGANACPPEDCGGIWGYYHNFLAALNNPNHEDHQMYTEWIGGKWDPTHFDLADINKYLQSLKA